MNLHTLTSLKSSKINFVDCRMELSYFCELLLYYSGTCDFWWDYTINQNYCEKISIVLRHGRNFLFSNISDFKQINSDTNLKLDGYQRSIFQNSKKNINDFRMIYLETNALKKDYKMLNGCYLAILFRAFLEIEKCHYVACF